MGKIDLSNDFRGTLDEIDAAFSHQSERILDLAGKLSFFHIAEFTIDANMPNICNSDFDRNGIYFFEIRNNHSSDVAQWLTQFHPIWYLPQPVEWFPGIKNMRVNSHTEFKEWIPLYIGKCRRVGVRINEHIHQHGLKRTFSMKLKARQNLHGWWFRVSWIPLDVRNYDMIAPALESALRNRFNPILGRQ